MCDQADHLRVLPRNSRNEFEVDDPDLLVPRQYEEGRRLISRGHVLPTSETEDDPGCPPIDLYRERPFERSWLALIPAILGLQKRPAGAGKTL